MSSDKRNPDISQSSNVPFVRPEGGQTGQYIGKAIAEVGGILAQERTRRINDSLSEELMSAQEQAIAEQEAALATPPDSQTGLAAGEAKTVQELQDRMDRLQLAANQGTQSMTALKIRQETILRDYMNRYPGLKAQFNQVASGVLGYSPLGAAVRAADAAAKAATTAGLGELEKFYLARASELKVDTTKFMTDPEQFWTDLQRASRVAQAEEESARWLSMVENQKGMAAFAEMGGVEDMASARVRSLTEGNWEGLRNIYRDAGITQEEMDALQGITGGSSQERAANALSALGQGKLEMIRQSALRQKEEDMRDFYEQAVLSKQGEDIAPFMTFNEFREQYGTQLDAAWDLIIQNTGDEHGMKIAKWAFEQRELGVANELPTDLLRIQKLNDMFGPDTTIGQMIIKGEMGDQLARMVWSHASQVLGLEQPLGQTGAGGYVVDPQGNVTRDPTVATGKLMLPEAFNIRTPADIDALNTGYQMIVAEQGQHWLDIAQRENDKALAAIGINLVAEYGHMVEGSIKNNDLRPTTQTDMAVIEMMASDAYRDAWDIAGIANRRDGFDGGEQQQNMLRILQEAAGRVAGQEIVRLRELMADPEASAALKAIDSRNEANLNRDPLYPGGIYERRVQPDGDFAAGLFRSYVRVNIDEASGNVHFVMKETTPQPFKEYTQFVIDTMNDNSLRQDRRVWGLVAKATANHTGATPTIAMNNLLRNNL